MAKSNFIVRGGADFSGIQQEMSKTEKLFGGFESKINKTFSGMGLNLGKFTKAALIGAGIKKLYDFGKASIAVAADIVEVQNVVDVTFGHMAGSINDFADNSIKQFGLSSLAAKEHASTMGAMLKSSGIAGEAVRDMSLDLTGLAADMASFYNLDNDEAFRKIMSGMSGMTMPLKELGINMNIANLQNYAMAQGIRKSWQEMNQAEQTMLRYNYLLSVTSDAQGDFARETNSWSNQVKILKMQWEEFMGLIGTALMEFLLPTVRALNWMLEGLIKITREIGKIYTMLTGREATVTSTVNNDIADSAGDAAEGEGKLADGIGKAAKAAKKALAPFDELNILQNNLNDGGNGGGSGLGGLNGLGNGGKGEVVTTMSTTQVDDGIDKSKERWYGFFDWMGNKWNGLKQAFAIPIMVPAPVFASIPMPIYQPEWGLTPPLVPAPVFQPILNPIYQPNWGLELPQIPVPVFPAIDYGQYSNSLEAIKVASVQTSNALETENSRVTKKIAEGFNTAWGSIESGYNKHKGKFESITTGISKAWETENNNIRNKVTQGLQTAWGTIETNYNKHKGNVGTIATGISTILVANINKGLSTVGTNINNTITTTQTNLQTWGKNIGGIAIESAKGLAGNIAEGLRTTATNTVSFANGHLTNMKTWGSGVLAVAGETARGFASNMASGFSSTWNSFKSLMSSMGEKVSGWFSENKSMVIKTTIAAGVVVGAGALALAVPAAIPYMASALGGLASIPALAKGGITNGEMVALIGDNPGGREVVSPLDDLLGMITTAVSSTASNNGSTNIVVKIGEDTILDKVVSGINRQSRINGETIITV